MPTLVVHGDADSRIPVECGRSLASGIAGAELHEIPGAEHGLMTNEAAGETQRIILDFLRPSIWQCNRRRPTETRAMTTSGTNGSRQENAGKSTGH